VAIAAPLSISPQDSSQDGGLVCARELPSGSIVDASAGKITLPNGSAVATTKIPCSMTSVVWCTSSCSGHVAEGDIKVSSSYYYTSYQDGWVTPPAPSSGSFNSSQGVGLYDSLQGGGDVMQPLLVYGCIISSDCSNSWRFSAYALVGGIVDYATPVSSSSSDTLTGTITYYASISGCISNGPGYGINAQDTHTSTHSILYQCTSDQFHAAATGSLEVHGLSTPCTVMPGTGSDNFGAISYATSPSGAGLTYTSGGDILGGFCGGGQTWNSNPASLTLSWTHS
jgi:hypothetical protein